MEVDPCKICGSKDMNLVDGFYYCVECGTQDVNARETVLEHLTLADGTFAMANVRKFTTAVQDGIEMSSEWQKWHIFNFILAGLTDELIALGAKPSFKMKVLWVWTRYIKKFQEKDDLETTANFDDEMADETIKSNGNVNNDSNRDYEDTDDETDLNASGVKINKKKDPKADTFLLDIKKITKGVLLSILYVALNIDKSDIQLSHLFRFIREGRLSLFNCIKFVPKELNIKGVNKCKSFVQCRREYVPNFIRGLAMTCFKRLDLGLPLVPDLTKIVKNYMQELSLPNDVKHLVFALMHKIPINLDLDQISMECQTRIPNYECVCMSYVIIALKMCFGLDCNYEVRLSGEIDKINEKQNFVKSYKLGMFSEPTDRLFSFDSWCQHLQFRKLILSKNYLPMAQHYQLPTDDYVYMEHLQERNRGNIRLSDDVTMDILNKIELEVESKVIPKVEFPATLTPMSTYTDIVSRYEQDSDVRLLLSEDFTQYSLKYALRDFELPSLFGNQRNVLTGVTDARKTFEACIIGNIKRNRGDMSMVYVRKCENKNWMKTNPPTIDHVTKSTEHVNGSDKDSDHGYDSNVEGTIDTDKTHISIQDNTYDEDFKDRKFEFIEEQDGNIFDDNFNDMAGLPRRGNELMIKEEGDNAFEFYNPNIDIDHASVAPDNTTYDGESMSLQFNPNAFNREKIIEELIQLACEKYKIRLPKEKMTEKLPGPRKRKSDLVNNDGTPIIAKKKCYNNNKARPGERKQAINNLISTYYTNIHNDIINEISEQVRLAIENQIPEPSPGDAGVPNFNSVPDANIDENEFQTDVNNDDIGAADENTSQVEISSQLELDNTTTDEHVEEEHGDYVVSNSDPKFDENTHDIKQLYIKIDEEISAEEIFELDDNSELSKILDKQIKRFSRHKHGLLNDFEEDNHSELDSELLRERKLIEKEKRARRRNKLEPLISDQSKIPSYQYWFRHYKSWCLAKSLDMSQRFDLEMYENYPPSFVFVVRECAAIAGCTMFSLYKNMQKIEQSIIRNAEDK